jgi:hypothetical protein
MLDSGPATSVRSIRFGFSWALAVSLRKPCSDVLDYLGFPWILSFESRLFNGLRGVKREKFFVAVFPRRLRAGIGACSFGTSKRTLVHAASLAYFLIFCN